MPDAPGPLRILVVDDDEDDFILTRDLLREADPDGYRCDWAPTYEAGRDALRRGEHDLALVDYRLGARTGLELLREVSAEALTVPVILLTGQGDRSVDIDAMRAGAVDYLTKGRVDPVLLERTVRYAIRQKQTEAALRLAVRQRDEVLGIVSHDLRNPLAAVRMGVKALGGALAAAGGNPAETYLEIIDRAVRQMDRLIEDLLDVARIESGTLSLRPHPQRIEPLLRQAVEELRHAAEARSIQVDVQVGEGLPLVNMDGDRVVQAVANLLDNAIKFTPENGRVAVRVTAEGDGVRVSVEDQGPGIRAEDLPHIFNRFWQARTLRRGGAGLGLAIADGLARAHGGRIIAESVPGQGATFHIILPCAGPDAETGQA